MRASTKAKLKSGSTGPTDSVEDSKKEGCISETYCLQRQGLER